MDMVAVSYGALGCNNIGGATESPEGYGCSVTEDAVVQMGTVAMSQGAAIVQMGMAAVSLLFSADGEEKVLCTTSVALHVYATHRLLSQPHHR